MKTKGNRLLLVLMITAYFLQNTLVLAQNKEFFDPLADEISSRLPPLEALIDSAVFNNPQMQLRHHQLTINEYELKSKRIEWTKSVGLRGSVGYGNTYNYTTTASSIQEPIPVASIRNQTQYNASVFLNLPLNTIIDRRNQVRAGYSEVMQAESAIEEQRNEIRQLVIIKLNELILKHRIFVLKANKLESIRVSMQMAETQFTNGTIPLSEYAQLAGNVSETEIDFEKARMEFLNAYMILEEIVGFKFNLFKTSVETNELN